MGVGLCVVCPCLLIFFLEILLAGFVLGDSSQSVGGGGSDTQSSRLVVTFRTASDNVNASDLDLGGARVVKQYGRRLVLDLGTPFDLGVQRGIFESKLRSVQSVELDYLVSAGQGFDGLQINDALVVMNATDPNVDGAVISPASQTPLWNLLDSEPYSIHAEGVWPVTNSTPDVVVAVIDTGMAELAKPLFLNLLDGYDFITDDGISIDWDGRDPDATDPGDWGDVCPIPSWHGTKVASILAARHDNEFGMKGIAQNCSILPVRVLGLCRMGYATDVTDAIVWSAGGTINGVPDNANPAKIISLSLAGQGACPDYLQSAVSQALALGSIVIAAAGNNNQNVSGFFPANCNGVISVAASTRGGKLAGYSNWGDSVAAPGGDSTNAIMTLGVNELETGLNVAFGMGTSFAVPHAAGILTWLFSDNMLPYTPNTTLSESNLNIFVVRSLAKLNFSMCKENIKCTKEILSVDYLTQMVSAAASCSVGSFTYCWNDLSTPKIADTCQLCTCPIGYIYQLHVTGFGLAKQEACLCPSGTTGTTTCSICSAGKFSTMSPSYLNIPPMSATSCTSCSDGKYSTVVGSGSSENCVPCTAGYISNSGSAVCYAIPPGNIPGNVLVTDDSKLWSKNPIVDGQYWKGCSKSQFMCKFGIYRNVGIRGFDFACCDLNGVVQYQSNCEEYCQEYDTIERFGGWFKTIDMGWMGYYISRAEKLNPGNSFGVVPDSVSIADASCPDNWYVNSIYGTRGSTMDQNFVVCRQMFVACRAGYYSPAPNTDILGGAIACPAGTYNPNIGSASSSACQNCNAGTYSNEGASVCTACPIGTYNPNTRGGSSASCTLCGAGKYSSLTSSLGCTDCTSGKFSSISGASLSSTCTNCVAGTYSSAAGTSACSNCVAGSNFSATAGATTCTACAVVTVCTQNLEYIKLCTPSSDRTCTTCTDQYDKPGYSSWLSNIEGSCIWQCDTNYYNSSNTCQPCKTSSSCGTGQYTTVCNSSADGVCASCTNKPASNSYYTGNSESLGVSTACPWACNAGYSKGASSCDTCQVGKYASSGSNTCTACSGGSYSLAGASACTQCQAGKYASSGSSACTECNSGSYSLAGAADCTQCPSGYKCPQPNVTIACDSYTVKETASRVYPPKIYDETSNMSLTTALSSFVGRTVYQENMTINNASYGNGVYYLYTSSQYPLTSAYYPASNCFFSSGKYFVFNTNQYSSIGVYSMYNYIVSDYLGDWIIIQLPNPIRLTGYFFKARYTFEPRAPGEWKIYGSNDGLTFNEIVSNASRLTVANYSNPQIGITFSVIPPLNTYYRYIGFTFNKLVGNISLLMLDELLLYGTELYDELVPASPAISCPMGSVSPITCPVGSYCPDSKTTLPCKQGSYCPTGVSAPIQCPPGTYSNAPSLGACLTCNSTSYTPTAGATACTLCPICSAAGYFRSGCGDTSPGTCDTCSNTS